MTEYRYIYPTYYWKLKYIFDGAMRASNATVTEAIAQAFAAGYHFSILNVSTLICDNHNTSALYETHIAGEKSFEWENGDTQITISKSNNYSKH